MLTVKILTEEDELEFSASPAIMSKYMTMIRRGIVSMFFMSTRDGEGARLDIYDDNSWKCVSPVLFANEDNEIARGDNASTQIFLSEHCPPNKDRFPHQQNNICDEIVVKPV